MPCSFHVILFVKNDVPERFLLSYEGSEGVIYLFILVSHLQEIVNIICSVKPDLFLLKDQLLGMTGLQIYDRLHATSKLEDVPALLLTEKQPDDEKAQKIAKRQIHVMMEPYALSELLDRIDEICFHQNSW